MTNRNYLSAELHYPPHPACESETSLLTVGSASHDRPWRCLNCGDIFDTPPDSPWYGIEELPETERRVWIATEIRDIPYPDAASIVGVKQHNISGCLDRAKKRLRPQPTPEAVTAGD